MVNLLEETIGKLARYGKTPKDVLFVRNRTVGYTWEEFEKVANREYYDGYGSTVVSTALMIVGEDWWMERAEYDGSEWWVFKRMPNKPDTLRSPTVEEIFDVEFD